MWTAWQQCRHMTAIHWPSGGPTKRKKPRLIACTRDGICLYWTNPSQESTYNRFSTIVCILLQYFILTYCKVLVFRTVDGHVVGTVVELNIPLTSHLSEYLALVPSLVHSKPTLEKINTPATVSPENWSYRMRPTIQVCALTALLWRENWFIVCGTNYRTRKWQTIKTWRMRCNNFSSRKHDLYSNNQCFWCLYNTMVPCCLFRFGRSLLLTFCNGNLPRRMVVHLDAKWLTENSDHLPQPLPLFRIQVSSNLKVRDFGWCQFDALHATEFVFLADMHVQLVQEAKVVSVMFIHSIVTTKCNTISNAKGSHVTYSMKSPHP